MQKNERYTVKIDGYTSEGAGVAHQDGMALFIPGVCAGETVEAHIVKVQKTFAYARCMKVLEESPERRDPDCPVYTPCGGCMTRHLSYAEELRMKERRVRDALERIAEISVPFDGIDPSPLTDGYRNRAQFPVAGDTGKAIAGFYRANSHDVIPTPFCRLQTPEANSILNAVLRWMNANRIPAYQETTGKGVVRHICARTSFQDRSTVLTLVCAAVPKALDSLTEAVREACPAVTGIVLNINAERTNVILGKVYRTIWGSEVLIDKIGTLAFSIRPASFFQVNPLGAETLYTRAREYLTMPLEGTEPYRPRKLLDLYCGTGTIGLFCADLCEEVTGVEIVEAAVRDAEANAERNGITNAHFHCGDAGEYARILGERGTLPDTVIVDPPRKGLSEEAVRTITALNPARIVYVSCDPATLARDLKRMGGSYRVVRARAVDMFPRTSHVETVCLLVRRNGLHIDIDVDVEEMLQEKRGQATYPQIKEYVLEQTGLKVSSLYISQVKRKCGLDVGDSYNKPKSEDARVPQCPPEKEKAIMDALRHFGIIS